MAKTREEYIAEYVRGVASLGGRARAKALPPERRRAIAKEAAAARWQKERRHK